jgi:hypothetical protein
VKRLHSNELPLEVEGDLQQLWEHVSAVQGGVGTRCRLSGGGRTVGLQLGEAECVDVAGIGVGYWQYQTGSMNVKAYSDVNWTSESSVGVSLNRQMLFLSSRRRYSTRQQCLTNSFHVNASSARFPHERPGSERHL